MSFLYRYFCGFCALVFASNLCKPTHRIALPQNFVYTLGWSHIIWHFTTTRPWRTSFIKFRTSTNLSTTSWQNRWRKKHTPWVTRVCQASNQRPAVTLRLEGEAGVGCQHALGAFIYGIGWYKQRSCWSNELGRQKKGGNQNVGKINFFEAARE